MAVAFSGGVDSSVLARCAAKRVQVVACTAYSEGAGDGARADGAASALGVDLVTTKLTAQNVREALAAMELPFEPTLMDKSLWCLFAITARSAREAGAGVLLLGQMADELFGGYAKYAGALESEGEDAAASMMDADIRGYAQRGRIRDVRAVSGWAEPRFPFDEEELVRFASTLPVSFKMRDGVRKAVLRKAAAILGVPAAQAEAGKKAAQYSSGVQKLLVGSSF